MMEWFCHVTCFAKVSLLLLKSCNIKVITFLSQMRRYHFFLVEIIVESENLIQMLKFVEFTAKTSLPKCPS